MTAAINLDHTLIVGCSRMFVAVVEFGCSLDTIVSVRPDHSC